MCRDKNCYGNVSRAMGTEKSSPSLSGESIKGKPYMGGAHVN